MQLWKLQRLWMFEYCEITHARVRQRRAAGRSPSLIVRCSLYRRRELLIVYWPNTLFYNRVLRLSLSQTRNFSTKSWLIVVSKKAIFISTEQAPINNVDDRPCLLYSNVSVSIRKCCLPMKFCPSTIPWRLNSMILRRPILLERQIELERNAS